MKIGIIAAGEEEVLPLLNQLVDIKEIHKAMNTYYIGKYLDKDLVLVRSGVCKVNAATCTQILIDYFKTTHIIMVGVAGAIDSTLKIGDTVMIEKVAHHDVDNDAVLIRYHPFMKDKWFYTNESIIKIAKSLQYESNLKVVFGCSVSGEAFIDQEGRDKIIDEFHPLCVDMETAAVAQVCYLNTIPFFAIRSISDTPDESGGEVFNANFVSVALNALSCLTKLLEQM